jgi:hypothetical protein
VSETKWNVREGQALRRVARELREFLTGIDEPEAKSQLADVEVIDRVGRWLESTRPIVLTDGIPAAGDASRPSLGTCRQEAVSHG